jgi:predicted ArsR family transcriptional regulator
MKQSTGPQKDSDMLADNILQQLKKHGQMLDSELATATGIPLKQIRSQLEDLSAGGVILACNVTRYQDGKPSQAFQCRISGYVPPVAPGRKPSNPVR